MKEAGDQNLYFPTICSGNNVNTHSTEPSVSQIRNCRRENSGDSDDDDKEMKIKAMKDWYETQEKV